MKNSIKILLILLSVTFVSCNDVQFKEAQPVDTKSLKVIPKEFRGTFINEYSYLLVGKKSFKFVNVDQSEITAGNIGVNIIIKQFDEKYYVSLKVPYSNYWRVGQISLSDKTLTVKSIIETEKVKKIMESIEYEFNSDDADSYKINPTKNEFQNIINMNSFDELSVLEKTSDSTENEEGLIEKIQKTIDENKKK